MVASWRQDGRMPTLEERVAYLEGRLGDHFAAVDDLRSTYREFRADSNRQFGDVRAEVEHLRTDMARQFVELRSQVDDLRTDTAREFGVVRNTIDGLRTEMVTQFRWLAEMQVTSILAIGSAVIGLYFK